MNEWIDEEINKVFGDDDEIKKVIEKAILDYQENLRIMIEPLLAQLKQNNVDVLTAYTYIELLKELYNSIWDKVNKESIIKIYGGDK